MGYERADDPDVDFESYDVVSLGTRLSWRFSRRVRAELSGGFSNSRMTNPGGYQRSWVMGGLIVDF